VSFDAFLRQLLAGKVQPDAGRTDVDLGPGLTIQYPEQLLDTQMPRVGQCIVRLAACETYTSVVVQHTYVTI